MFQFYWPWFFLILPLPFFIKMIAPLPTKKNEENAPTLYFPSTNRLKKIFPSYKAENKQKDRISPILFSLLWLFLTLTLMQPERVNQCKEVKNSGYDLMLAVDISSSMQAVDFSNKNQTISRLDATKEVVGKFVIGRQGDRVGLVVFGESAYLHVPLTLDTASVSRLLNDTVSGMAGNATAIGDAIGLSIRSLRERPEGSRVLVLLTDGDDNSSSIPPLEAAKLAKLYGIKIYTIGVGRSGLVPFPNGFGGYSMAQMSMDEKLLQEISEKTGGQHFSATDQKALEAIYNKINELERTESNETIVFIREPLYYYPLAISMVLILILSLYLVKFRRSCNDF